MSIVGHLSGLHRGRLSADPPASRLQHRREPEASRPRTVHPRAEGRQLDARKTGKTGFNNFLFGVFLSFKFLLCPIIHLSPNFLPWLGISVTRFGEIPPLWQILKIFGNIFKVYLVLGNFSAHFGTISMLLGKILIAENGQILKKQSGRLVTLLGIEHVGGSDGKCLSRGRCSAIVQFLFLKYYSERQLTEARFKLII